VITRILFAPLLWLAGLRGPAVGVVIAFRFLIDWNRIYRELWLNREKKAKVEGSAYRFFLYHEPVTGAGAIFQLRALLMRNPS